MKIEAHIAVVVTVDNETGACTLMSVDSEAWPADTYGSIWIEDKEEWCHRQQFPKENELAIEFLEKQLANAPRS